MDWCKLKKTNKTKDGENHQVKFKPGCELVRPPFDEWNLKDDLMKMDAADANFLSFYE